MKKARAFVVRNCGECPHVYRFRPRGRFKYQCSHPNDKCPKSDGAIMGFMVRPLSIHPKCPLPKFKEG